jgi:phytoene dehydrogenase-like protein
MKKYSLIVVGGGITGLSSAIAWAKNVDVIKHPVLVIEKNKIPGGMVTSYKREGFLFDTAQLIPESNELFEYLGIDIELKQFNNYFTRIFIADPVSKTSRSFNIPSSYEGFRDKLIEQYPKETKSIQHFFNVSKKIANELFYLKVEPKPWDFVNILMRCPNIVRNASKTFREYFRQFGFRNKELEELFDVFAAFSGLPAERAVAMMTVAAMNTTLVGAYRPVKGFIELPVQMRKRLKQLGGEMMVNTQVSRFIIENGKIKGVEINDGQIIEAEQVVTTIDPKVAMGTLAGYDVLEEFDKTYARKVKECKMSCSSFIISLGLNDKSDLGKLGFDCGYNVLTTGKDTFQRLFEYHDKGVLHQDDHCFHLAAICPSLTTGGKPVLIIRVVPVPLDDWVDLRNRDYEAYQQKKNEAADFYIQKAEQYMIPNLSKHIVTKDIATPATFERYSGSPTGSNYDMAPYPDNFGLKRLKMRTPVKGLYQPKFSHGIWPSLQAGLQVVDMMLKGKVMNGYSRYRKRKD